ncbi:sperm axonemal maintenance protein CFAP97D1-like [Oscarella lobularis]|uniref:sperm axonemal maintenance protein CFAP97D1-like n=1 Tax=Oscarella lobularis TaxID=121494 RepID=UPI0033134D52
MHHRAYQSITPANNSFLKRKWDQIRFDTHRNKVATAKAVIDNEPPRTYLHLQFNLKKLQMAEERQAIVERDNRILLEKMASVLKMGGRVDNRNYYHHRSLNKTKRQRELLFITHENRAILKRIKSREPHYNHVEWLQQWRVNQGYMIQISKYQHQAKKNVLTKKKKDDKTLPTLTQSPKPAKTPPRTKTETQESPKTPPIISPSKVSLATAAP